jgi:hypothetical protein
MPHLRHSGENDNPKDTGFRINSGMTKKGNKKVREEADMNAA